MNLRRLLVMAIVVGALLLVACGDDAGTTTSAGPTGEPYPQEFVEGYMQGCTTEATEDQCRCTLEEFQKEYTFEEFLEFAVDADQNDPRILEIVTICAR